MGMFILPITVGVCALAGLLPCRADVMPSSWEARAAHSALIASVRRHAPRLANPVAPTIENLREGLALYRQNCAGCHGGGATDSRWGTEGFYPRVPQFRRTASELTDSQIVWVLKHGIRYTGMASWEGLLSDEQMWKVATFVSSVERLPPELAAQWQKR